MLRMLPTSVPEAAFEPDRSKVSVKAPVPVTSVPDCGISDPTSTTGMFTRTASGSS